MIPQSFLQDLLNRVDIVEVVGRYVQLKKGGANFMGLCPFHNEKSPSFTVSPTKQFYHCFGCGAHGSAISFLMEHAGLGFVDAVEELARNVGLDVPREAPIPGAPAPAVQRAQTLGLVDVMTHACDYYRKQLRGAPVAIEYLKRRGLTGEIAAHFGLGYAPDAWQNLEAAFRNYRDDQLLDAGLVIESEKGEAGGAKRRYDRFRDRIMFPIRNTKGQVIAFGGRVLDKGEPKYLNSPETPLFSKGSELYGLFEARAGIRDAGYVLVVEGYMDVVALAQLGFPQAVATLGTACTPMHVQKLLRQTETVVFSFDGDAAGRRAARRALEACLQHADDNRSFKFLFLPSEHDPDSYVREYGANAFAEEVSRAMPLSQFLIGEVTAGKEMHQPEGRARALFEAKPLLQQMPANALRGQILHALAERVGSSVEEVAELCELQISVARRQNAWDKVPAKREKRLVVGQEHKALRNLLMFPVIGNELTAEETNILSNVVQHAEIFTEVLAHCREMGGKADFTLIKDRLRASPNWASYDDIAREIVQIQENVRDIVTFNPEDEEQVERRKEQIELRLTELRGSIRRLQFDSINEELKVLFARSSLTSDDLARAQLLSRQRDELSRLLAPVGTGGARS
ncbi:DNA primase [Pandoraea communis]|uniref:DNA primase n=1 Tax=Pandoraea communis TaxID=2508297 RepID=A0A5E4YG72_9BURK|nr:DNA primase [Pandoraea communis]MDM8356737.1 DNA primase [Pandoraea communis]VVE47751.1 DNA primase [Pandoraea communis]